MHSLLDEARSLAVIAAIDLEVAETIALGPQRLHQMVLVHCQQAAEKWLKALVAADGQAPPKVHDVSALLGRLRERHPELDQLEDAADVLTEYAVAPRCVVLRADPWLVIVAIHYARQVRDVVVPLLPEEAPTAG